MLNVLPTREQYAQAFARESEHEYPTIDALEAHLGYAIDRPWLLGAARVLACPVKVNAPNWQHGRVLYAVARAQFAEARGRVLVLDIGTAKGFSALCLQRAILDSGATGGQVVSVDVIDPRERVTRNTVAELEAPRTLREILAPWPEADAIRFFQSTGVDWLERYTGRIELAFVDGKHTAETVWKEGLMLAERQQAGDLVVFDDVHLPPIREAVAKLARYYEIDWISILPTRAYARARRRG